MRSSISAAERGGLTAANSEGGKKGSEYEELQLELRGLLFYLHQCLVFPPPPPLTAVTLRSFLLRPYQHICLEKLVFPSIFQHCVLLKCHWIPEQLR